MIRPASLLLLALFSLTATQPAFAQKKKKKNKKAETESAVKPNELEKNFDETTAKCHKFEGLFELYRDTTSGKSYLAVDSAQLGKEFIYFSYVADGVLEAGFNRGSYRGSKIIRFERHYDRIEIHVPNTGYYFDQNSELSRAADANINTPIISSLKIEGKKGSKYLVDGDALFLSEDFQMIKPPSRPGSDGQGMLGNLSKDKTKINQIRNYPENTDVVVSYVYDNKSPSRGGSAAVTDPRSIVVDYQHSLIAVPNNDFISRRDDARIGYFSTQVTDLTSFEAAPWKDVIHRWNLVKKNPEAALSEPVEPITWWIENTTPREFRAIIKEGVERWNTSFEKAGFINAVVVKEQPDDADWDAGDIRYNVLRWTSSPQPPFGGYGPSFVNPRTGEILGADIMLEFAAISNRLFRNEVFKLAGVPGSQEFATSDEDVNPHHCSVSDHLHHSLQFGLHGMRAMNIDKAAREEFVKQTLQRLVLHEVGHTLGLTHNMRASTLHSPEDLKRKEVVEQFGLCSSVMEYPAVHFPTDEMDHQTWFDSNPGVYDDWVIEYGYSPSLPDPAKEEERLSRILERSADPKLAYGNDADDMRSSGKGIDPDVNIYDLSNDPVAYGIERIDLVKSLMPKLLETYALDGESYQELLNAYYVLTGEVAVQARVMTRQIGGVHYDRSYPGQNAIRAPFEPVGEDEQRKAMKALADYVFAPDAFDAPDQLYNYLIAQRRGFSHFSSSIDPKLHDRMLGIQQDCLNHLLHPSVLQRITDSQLYGGTYDLAEVISDLTDAIFKADSKGNVNTMRQNLQIDYLNRLSRMLDAKSPYDNLSKSMAVHELKRIEGLTSGSTGDTLTKAHRTHIRWIISQALES